MVNKVLRVVLESMYGFILFVLKFYECVDRLFIVVELFRVYVMFCGYVVFSGLFDEIRVFRIILKDYFSGKLLFCYVLFNEE